jgi:C-terminal processing protease CtpA/Prc
MSNSKKSKRGILLLIVAIMVSITACRKDNSKDVAEEVSEEINDWILENMQIYYLWEAHLPQKTDKTLYPSDYFQSLLYKPTDRFSVIYDNYIELQNALSGVNTEAGYEFTLFYMSSNSSDVIGYITYIKPGTPAEAAGLKRGDYFLEINNTQITGENYSSLLDEISKPHLLGIAVLSGNTIVDTKNVSLSVIENYAENPILLDTIYEINGKSIGYFVYNFFATDDGDESLQYEKELNELFRNFKSVGINELIVDLRYNGGGMIRTAEALAAMISGRSKSEVFYSVEYNELLDSELKSAYGADYNKAYFVEHIVKYGSSGQIVERTPINSLSGLSTVYFIVSNRSASASELLINGLIPYMNVVLIGEETYGKNVGSIVINEEDPVKQKTNTWGMLPIIAKYANATGFSEYGTGFTPDKEVSEYESVTVEPLGDTDEVMLKTALNQIFGISGNSRTKNTRNQALFVGSSIDRMPVRRNMIQDNSRFQIISNNSRFQDFKIISNN